jgi:hypothetical protein
MKIVIDIPECTFSACKQYHNDGVAQWAESVIATGTPLPEGEWISVDTTLPKYTGLYLVSIDSLVTVANFDGTVFRDRASLKPLPPVDAWQPLPKSYKNAED